MAFRSRVAAYSSAGASFFPQGLTLVSHCSQRLVAWLPAAGTPHTRVRPWKERHRLTEKGALPIDLPGHPCDPTGTRADDGLDAGTASYPRGVLRGERPKWLFAHFGQSKWAPAERPWKGAGFCPENWRRPIPPTRRCGLCIPRLAPERRGKSRSRRRTSSPHQTRLRWALAGAPSCRATSLCTREALSLAVTGSRTSGGGNAAH